MKWFTSGRAELLEISRGIREQGREQSAVRDELVLTVEHLRIKVGELADELKTHRELTDNQYTTAYARTAEVHYENACEEAKHRRILEKEMYSRWVAHSECLQEQIACLKLANDRLIRHNDKLQTVMDEGPRLNQMRDWMLELMKAFNESRKTPPKKGGKSS